MNGSLLHRLSDNKLLDLHYKLVDLFDDDPNEIWARPFEDLDDLMMIFSGLKENNLFLIQQAHDFRGFAIVKWDFPPFVWLNLDAKRLVFKMIYFHLIHWFNWNFHSG